MSLPPIRALAGQANTASAWPLLIRSRNLLGVKFSVPISRASAWGYFHPVCMRHSARIRCVGAPSCRYANKYEREFFFTCREGRILVCSNLTNWGRCRVLWTPFRAFPFHVPLTLSGCIWSKNNCNLLSLGSFYWYMIQVFRIVLYYFGVHSRENGNIFLSECFNGNTAYIYLLQYFHQGAIGSYRDG